MLSKIDREVMRYIYLKSYKKGTSLISPQELISSLKNNLVISPEQLNNAITNLQLDNYIDFVVSNTKGKQVYCFTLKQKGEAFLREQENIKKTNIKLVVRTILLAILSFIVGIILKSIFKG